MTKFFKGKNKSKEIKAEPRILEEINKEYSDLIGQLGMQQFKKLAAERIIKYVESRLLEVNDEANLRTELDKKSKENEAKSEVQ